ncbi:hypothetical protein [Caudoviricetes sp.]|nr:hypothetical protein [Caudoviricetes sp.]
MNAHICGRSYVKMVETGQNFTLASLQRSDIVDA